jgi:hypothetical protein
MNQLSHARRCLTRHLHIPLASGLTGAQITGPIAPPQARRTDPDNLRAVTNTADTKASSA